MTSGSAVDEARRWLAEHADGAAAPPALTPGERGAHPTDTHAGPGRPNAGPARPSADPVQPHAGPGGFGADPHQPNPSDLAPGGPAAGSGGPDADPVEVARTIVLRLLTASARTRHELAEALRKRNVPECTAEAVLDRMEAARLIDDASFARSWVESRQQRRHLSRRSLRHELLRKGVDRDHIDAALDEIGADDELTAARALGEKKLRSLGGLDRSVQYRRLAGALSRRGFNPGIIATVLSELLD